MQSGFLIDYAFFNGKFGSKYRSSRTCPHRFVFFVSNAHKKESVPVKDFRRKNSTTQAPKGLGGCKFFTEINLIFNSPRFICVTLY
jgi:hypothetical protein